MFRITVVEIRDAIKAIDKDTQPGYEIERYSQTVDAIDLRLVQKAVNTKPRAPRVRKTKAAS